MVTIQRVAGSDKADRKSRVLVIYTGGTCGMVPSEEDGSLVPSPAYLSKTLLTLVSEQSDDFPNITIHEFDNLIDSSDMGPEDWIDIAQEIEKHYYMFDGFVVLTGTDTMAYAASSLSFLFENLGKCIIFTGSMLPLYKGYSDARRNILISIYIAGTRNICEVCLFFQDKLLRANRAKKVNANALSAFDSPNFPPLGVAGTHLQLHDEHFVPPPKRPLRLHTSLDSNVLVIRLIPGFRDDTLDLLIQESVKLRALVLELYGVGNAPGRKSRLLNTIETAVANGIIVAICSQCWAGSVNLETYAVGKSLKRVGAISMYDMTVESVATKLAFLLGQKDLSVDEVKAKLVQNLRGELTESLKDSGGTSSNLIPSNL